MRIATLPANIHIESLQIQSRSANHHTVTFSGYVGSVQQNRLSLRGLKKGGGGQCSFTLSQHTSHFQIPHIP